MSTATAEKLRGILSQGRWEQAVALLERLESAVAADLLTSVPFEQQQVLFRKLPVDFAAKLIESIPYYHAYVLLHSRPIEEMNAIVNLMNPGERQATFSPGSRCRRGDCPASAAA
jgi:Mg/Co/Ni transporter MgtE